MDDAEIFASGPNGRLFLQRLVRMCIYATGTYRLVLHRLCECAFTQSASQLARSRLHLAVEYPKRAPYAQGGCTWQPVFSTRTMQPLRSLDATRWSKKAGQRRDFEVGAGFGVGFGTNRKSQREAASLAMAVIIGLHAFRAESLAPQDRHRHPQTRSPRGQCRYMRQSGGMP